MDITKNFINEETGLFNENYYSLDEIGVGGIATLATLSPQPTIRTYKFDNDFDDDDLSFAKNDIRNNSLYEIGDMIPTLANSHLNTRELGMTDMLHPLEDEGNNKQEAIDVTPEGLVPNDVEGDYYDIYDDLVRY